MMDWYLIATLGMTVAVMAYWRVQSRPSAGMQY